MVTTQHPLSYSSPAPLAFVFSLGLLIAACFPTISALMVEWFTPVGHFSHGLLLLALGLWFVWEHRHRLKLRFGSASLFGLVILIGSAVLWLAAMIGNVLAVQYVAIVGVLAGMWFAIFTLDSFHKVLWRFSIVGLALPIWEIFNAPLQAVSAFFVSKLLWLVDVPHYLEETFVSLPNGDFEIAGGCSGLGFVMTGLSLAFYILATARVSLARAGIVLLLSLAIALVTNWVRIAIIIYIGYVSDMQSSIVADHLWVGWVCFAIMAFPFFLWLSGTAVPVAAEGGRGSQERSGVFPTFAVSAVILAIAGLMYTLSVPDSADASVEFRLEVASPSQAVPWKRCGSFAPPQWQPHFEGADADQTLTLCDPVTGEPVWIRAAYYNSERQGKELIFYKNDPVGFSRDVVSRVAGVDEEVVNAFATDDQRYVLRQWYLVEGRKIADERQAKLRQIMQGLLGRHGAYSVTLLMACQSSDCVSTHARLSVLSAGLEVVAHAD